MGGEAVVLDAKVSDGSERVQKWRAHAMWLYVLVYEESFCIGIMVSRCSGP